MTLPLGTAGHFSTILGRSILEHCFDKLEAIRFVSQNHGVSKTKVFAMVLALLKIAPMLSVSHFSCSCLVGVAS